MSEHVNKRPKLNHIHIKSAFNPKEHSTVTSTEEWIKARKVVLAEEKELR